MQSSAVIELRLCPAGCFLRGIRLPERTKRIINVGCLAGTKDDLKLRPVAVRADHAVECFDFFAAFRIRRALFLIKDETQTCHAVIYAV